MVKRKEMKLEDIKSEEMVAQYIEGTLNDFEACISTKQETELHIHRLIIYLIKLDKAFVAGRSQTSWEQFKVDFNITE